MTKTTNSSGNSAEDAVGKSRYPSWVTALSEPSFWADWASAVGLLGLVVLFTILKPVFITGPNLQALLVAAAILIVLAVGQTFVIMTAGIDLSLAASVMLGAIVLGLTNNAGWDIGYACLFAVMATCAIGFLNGLCITSGKIPDFVVTLGSLSIVTGIGLILSGGNPNTVSNLFLLKLASGSLGILGYPFLIACAVALVSHVVLFHTRFGVHLMATGGQQENARSLGIRTGCVRIAAYTISGACGGVAAILLVARIGSAEPTINTNLLLNSVAAVVLGGVSLFGGRGSILGPVLGAVMLTTLVNGLTLLSVSAFYQPVAVGMIVVMAALIMRYQK